MIIVLSTSGRGWVEEVLVPDDWHRNRGVDDITRFRTTVLHGSNGMIPDPMHAPSSRRPHQRRKPLRRLSAVAGLALALACLAACSTPATWNETGPAGVAEFALGVPPGAVLPAGVRPVDGDGPPPWAERGFANSVVATSEPEATRIAARVLAAGGNAIDAAAAAQFALNVVEPQSSGIGGGGFMMIHLSDSHRTVVIDSREIAPADATPGMFAGIPFAVASTSGLSVGVPGTLLGIAAALDRFGTTSLAEALAPAIALAESGFPVGSRLAEALASALGPGGRLANDVGNPAYDAARRIFAPGGVPVAEGEILRQPDLARTFRLIAERGLSAFYECADAAGIAPAIIAAQRAFRTGHPSQTGRMTCEDFAAYAATGPVLRPPVVGRYRGWVVASTPPPSSGGIALLQMLTMLERFPLGDAPAGFGFGATATLAVMQEAMRLAFADRAVWVGDPDSVPGLPIAGLFSADYLAKRAGSCPDDDPNDAFYCIMPESRLPRVEPGTPGADEGTNTTHLTVIDRDGAIVTLTSSIEAAWGTGLMVPGFGFLLNNQLTDFNLTPAADPTATPPNPGANDVAPFKRPRSSMAPTILLQTDERGHEHAVAAFGSPGGGTIINTLLNVTLNLVDHRMAIQTAIDAPRLSLTRANGGEAQIEPGFDPVAIDRLKALGYAFAVPTTPATTIGSVQAIVIDPRSGLRYGGADRRRRGTVAGLP